MQEPKGLTTAVSLINEKLNYVRSGIRELRRLKGDISKNDYAGSILEDKKESLDKTSIILYVISGLFILSGIILSASMGITMKSETDSLWNEFNDGIISLGEYREGSSNIKGTYLIPMIIGFSVIAIGLILLALKLLSIHKARHEAKVLSRSSLKTERSGEIKRLSQELYQILSEMDAKIASLRKVYTGDLSILTELENDSHDLKRALNIVSGMGK